MRNKNFKISIVLPCHNEEGNVRVLFDKLSNCLKSYQTEIIFVDDCSTDNTLFEIQKLSKSNLNVKYLSFSKNFGHQMALRAGLEFAIGDCIVSLDADLQHPPDLIPTMIEKWLNGADIVNTIRIDDANTPALKRITSSYFYKFFNALTDLKMSAGSADFRLLDRKVVNVINKHIKEYHLFVRGIITWIGYSQETVEYIAESRHAGNSKYSFKKMLNFALDGITSFSIKPLRLSIYLGFFLFIFSTIYASYAVYIALFTEKATPGWTSVLVSTLFIGSVNMMILGIIGEYVGKTYMQSKNRPHFVINKTNIENA